MSGKHYTDSCNFHGDSGVLILLSIKPCRASNKLCASPFVSKKNSSSDILTLELEEMLNKIRIWFLAERGSCQLTY